MAFADPLVGVDGQTGAGVEERLYGLPAALQRTGDDLGDRQAVEPGGQRGGLGGAAFVQTDAGDQPASTPAVLAVDRPCLTRSSMGMRPG